MLTMQQLEESKIFQKEGVSFTHPLDVSNGWIKTFGQPDIIRIDKEVTNLNEDGTKNTSYGRVLMQKILGTEPEYNPTVGIIIAFDTMQVKLYAGVNVSACTNLCVFNATWLQSFKLTSRLDDRIGLLEAVVDKSLIYADTIRDMKLAQLHKDLVHKLHSQMILEHRRSKDKAMYGESFTNRAFADILMEESKSEYAMGNSDYTSEWNVYNALTSQLNREVLGMPDKSLEVYNLIKELTIN